MPLKLLSRRWKNKEPLEQPLDDDDVKLRGERARQSEADARTRELHARRRELHARRVGDVAAERNAGAERREAARERKDARSEKHLLFLLHNGKAVFFCAALAVVLMYANTLPPQPLPPVVVGEPVVVDSFLPPPDDDDMMADVSISRATLCDAVAAGVIASNEAADALWDFLLVEAAGRSSSSTTTTTTTTDTTAAGRLIVEALQRNPNSNSNTAAAASTSTSISRFFSIVNVVYGFGALVMTGACGFVLSMTWRRGTAVALIGGVYGSLFYLAARALFHTAGSEAVGGVLFVVPVLIAPIVTVGLLKASGVCFPPVRPDSDSSSFRARFEPLSLRDQKRWPSFLIRACFFLGQEFDRILGECPRRLLWLWLVLEASVICTAVAIWTDCRFPLIAVPFFAALWLSAITAAELLETTDPARRATAVPLWMYISLGYCAVTGALSCDARLLQWAPSTPFARALLPSALSAALADVDAIDGIKLVAAVASAVTIVWTLPYAVASHVATGRNALLLRRDPAEVTRWVVAAFPDAPPRSSPRVVLSPGALEAVFVYALSNLVLLTLALWQQKWAFVPAALTGLVITVPMLPRRKFRAILGYHTPVALYLLLVSLAFQNSRDAQLEAVLRWFGDEGGGENPMMRGLALLSVRGCITSVAFTSLTAAVYGLVELYNGLRATARDEGDGRWVSFKAFLLDALFIVICTALNGHLSALARADNSWLLGAFLNLAAASVFVLSLWPILPRKSQTTEESEATPSSWFTLERTGMLAGDRALARVLGAFALAFRQAVVGGRASILQYDVGCGIVLTVLVLLVLRGRFRKGRSWHESGNHGINVGCAIALLLIALSSLAGTRLLAFLGIAFLYAAVTNYVSQHVGDSVGLAVLLTLVSAATIHMGITFQVHYLSLQAAVERLTPSLLRSLFVRDANGTMLEEWLADTLIRSAIGVVTRG